MKTLAVRLGVLVVGVTLAQGCASIQVKTDYDPKTQFAGYHTFQLSGGTPAPSELTQQRLDEALVSALQAKGLKRAESGADLKVYSHVRISVETHIDYDSFGYAGYGYGRYGYAYAGPSSATVREYPVGTLVVDLVDAAQKKLVWRGTASGYLNERITPEQATVKTKQVMDQLFATYPPAPAK